ncbi:MAG: tetraacyldisaccharide 4'-kinase [Phycisphaeraceae bacterium]|nr:MAG: tetraacyldisaccharide 4'-kinase [Phycisphaeraceae bacterium]
MPNALGAALSWVYGRAVSIRNGWYDVNAGRRLDRPVISVGNLSVGGTGKTPMVAHLARWLREAGRTVAVALRGYRAPGGNPSQSDEALLYARTLPGVMLAIGPDRHAELKELFTTRRGMTCDCVLLDDGFQHRRLARDLDLVLIDATRDPFKDRLLPAGWLREPVSSLARASAVIVTRADTLDPASREALGKAVASAHGKPPLAWCSHRWESLVTGEGLAERTLPVGWLKGRRAVAACAIGNPAAFVGRIEQDAGVVGRVILRDHDPFAPATLDRIARAAREGQAEVIVVTEKDWVKLRELPADRFPCPVLRPRLGLTFLSGEGALHDLVVGTARSFKPVKPATKDGRPGGQPPGATITRPLRSGDGPAT